MPRGGRPSRTPTLSAGPSTPQTTPSRFSLLQEMMNEDNIWESGSDSSSYSDYDYNACDSGDDTVASSMLPIFATGGKKKPKKKKGKGKATPAPATKTSLGGSLKLPVVDLGPKQQQRFLSETVPTDKDEVTGEMPIEIVEELVGKAFISVMEGHFAKL